MPQSAEPLDDELVVDDLVIDVERRPEELEGPLEALDRHVDPAQKPRGLARMIFIASRSSWIARGNDRPYPYAFGRSAARRSRSHPAGCEPRRLRRTAAIAAVAPA